MVEEIRMQNNSHEIISELKKVIVGKDEVLKKVYMAILAGGHVLLEDVPGVGKTTLALALCKVMGLSYKRVQFTPDSVPSDLTGFSIYDQHKGSFQYQEGAVMTNLLLADEINRTSSKTQSALLEVMEEGQVTVDTITRFVPEPFMVIATQNPVGSLGTQMLPSSQLDRFMIRLHMGYPDFKSQVKILKDRHGSKPLESLETVVSMDDLMLMKEEVSLIHMQDDLYEYVTGLSEATRNHESVSLGLSPRGALALCEMAKAHAYYELRDYVIPSDITQVFTEITAHRLMMTQKARMSSITPFDVIKEILVQVPMPSFEEKRVKHS